MEAAGTPANEDAISTDSGMELHVDDEDSQDTVGTDAIVTKEMMDEEAKLAKANEKLLEKERLQKEKELNDEMLRQQSKKRLLTLLKKSKFYASYMRRRVEEHEKKLQQNMSRPPSKKRKLNEPKYSKEMVDSVAGKNEQPVLADITNQSSSSSAEKAYGTRMTPMGIMVSEEQPLLLEGACLRDYQLAGFRWLKSLFETGMNGMLADEMGLGKTIQTIALICHLYANGVLGPFLIVAPLSTLPNWIHEFEMFAPKIPVTLYHGSEKNRSKMAKSLLKPTKLLDKSVLPVIITSYEVPFRDQHILGRITWKYMVVDEGHRIKNHKSQLARVLGGFKSVNRLLLTGTPLQNNLTELWSLLHFLLPEVFDSLDVFETLFTAEELEKEEDADACLEKEKKSKILTLLHEILTPFLLRRLKTDVDLAIPKKKEILVRCPMTKIQLELYKAVLDKSILVYSRFYEDTEIIPDGPDGKKLKRYAKGRDLSTCYSQRDPDWDVVRFGEGDGAYKLHVKMTFPMTVLIKILNHPYLVHPKVLPGSNIMQVDNELIESSGKMTILDGLLRRLKERGHRVLIFSTYTSMLNIIEEYLIMVGHEYRRLDGSTHIDDRRTYIREFNTDPSIFVFILSTRAGGLGVNLTGADTVIIYNSDWNPQADLQAQDRCHRIGQTKPVLIYRFMVPTTIDEHIVNRAYSKRKLEKMVIQKGMFKDGACARELPLEELKALLNEKQHNLEVQPNGTVFTDEQWEALLDRSGLE